ncbi:MAG: RHS repeat-associated core domain-containing protein, partial [Syntrophobacteraceae bacterium]
DVVKELDYDSFGNILSDSDPTFRVPFAFAGGLYDPDTGLVHFGYRDYDPDTGTWTAKDPILFKGGDTNLFGYCLNDPVNWIDTFGLIYNPYSLKALAGDVIGLAGLSAIVAGVPVIGVPLVAVAVGLELWEAFAAPSEIETQTQKELAPIQDAFKQEQDDLKRLEKELKQKNPGTCPLRH